MEAAPAAPDDWEGFGDGVQGGHGPYYVLRPVSDGGAVFQVHSSHVVRDMNSSYPVLPNEWAHMCESGKHACWNSGALFAKPSRCPLPKTIVVLRLGVPESEDYVWCVRMRVELEELQPHHPCQEWGCGSSFLWPLSWEMARELYVVLARDVSGFAQSSLVLSFVPAPFDFSWSELPFTRRVKSLPRVQDRALVASLHVTSCNRGTFDSLHWTSPSWLRGLGKTRLPRCELGSALRRSPRFDSPPLVEVLGSDLVGEVLRSLLASLYLSPRYVRLATVLDTRLVCRSFNAAVCDGAERTCDQILRACKNLRDETDLAFAYAARIWLTDSGVSVFRAMGEAWSARARKPTQREAVLLWMRLVFNKKQRSLPPGRPKTNQMMVCVYGEALNSGSGYGTRRQSQKRVRFRLSVPLADVPKLRARGWEEWEEPNC